MCYCYLILFAKLYWCYVLAVEAVFYHDMKKRFLNLASLFPWSCHALIACVSSYWSQIPTEDFSKDPNMKQYVYLQAQFPDVELEKVVLVSFQFGYIFIQTDKTLYTPNSKGELYQCWETHNNSNPC